MFIGEYTHSIDDKGRAILPLVFRKIMGEEFIITKGLDGCLSAYHLEEWKRIEKRVNSKGSSKSRKVNRFLFAGATLVTPDKQGRILFPKPLKDYASLEKDIVFTGVSVGIEIWNKDRWQENQEAVTQDMIADLMDDLDV